MGRRDDRVDPASDEEVANNLHEARMAGSHEVVEDLVRHRLVEGAFVPVRPEIELEALELHAERVGNVPDPDRREIRLAGPRTEARELGALEGNLVVPSGLRVGKGLDRFGRLRGHG